MALRQFKAESKRLLDLMIHSIYTHREIFLRELISNASDALDKRYFQSLSQGGTGLTREELEIRLDIDREKRLFVITDNGVGMTREELEKDLGTIAKSGSLDFKEKNAEAEDVDIIGQFGVGFYSAFMVADQVTVESRAAGADDAWQWTSRGSDGYSVSPCGREDVGTRITLTIKEDTEEEHYSEFLEKTTVEGLVRRYSDYIRYPIRMMMEHSHKKEDSDEYETVSELVTLNTMVPIWRKAKSEVTDEEYNSFYKEKFRDFQDPLLMIHSRTEGSATYNALLFIPAAVPYNYYSKDFEKGLQLYGSGVLIMDKCADLLPDHFSFVRGLVDSEDLSLNISREMLQHDRQLQLISRSLERRIRGDLQKLLKEDREKYEAFWKAFGLQLKYGVYSSFGQLKDSLADLLLFHSSTQGGLVTLAEYLDRMKEGQTAIYYACGGSVQAIDHLPQTELVKDKGYEILYLTDDVDEFTLKMMHQYGEKDFKSVSDPDLGLESDSEKETLKEETEARKELLEAIKERLGGKVSSVTLTSRLKSAPACITAAGDLSLEMEKVLGALPGENAPRAQRVLELNPGHPVFETLCRLFESDKEKLGTYSQLLYDQALLLEGLPIEDPSDFAQRICGLMV